MASTSSDRVFAALLKYWRGTRGMSQLDLAVTAEVSARHISFLETGRSQPSVEMVHLLTETLGVPLRDRNELLRAAGFPPQYDEPSIDDALDGALGLTLQTMLDHHEPFPLVVVDRLYRVVTSNQAAARMMTLGGFPLPEQGELNLLDIMFDPAARDLMMNWDQAATTALRRLQREVFLHPQDDELQALLDRLVETPGVPESWRRPDPSAPNDPTVTLELRLKDTVFLFLTTVTTFNAPSNVTLDELRIESWFPLDEPTKEACRMLLSDDGVGQVSQV